MIQRIFSSFGRLIRGRTSIRTEGSSSDLNITEVPESQVTPISSETESSSIVMQAQIDDDVSKLMGEEGEEEVEGKDDLAESPVDVDLQEARSEAQVDQFELALRMEKEDPLKETALEDPPLDETILSVPLVGPVEGEHPNELVSETRQEEQEGKEYTVATVSGICCVCLEEVDSLIGADALHLTTSSTCEAKACADCLERYFTSVINSGFSGYCPRMKCLSSSCELIIESKVWMNFIEEELVEAWEDRASDILTIQCADCHERGSMMESCEHAACEGSEAFLQAVPEAIRSTLPLFETGRLDAHEFLKIIYEHHSAEVAAELAANRSEPLEESEQERMKWDLVRGILCSIEDSERRASLHCRFLRQNPMIETHCCGLLHCFNCKVADGHQDLTCEEYQAGLAEEYDTHDNSVLSCPGCGVQLVKGDGCDSITCVCGDVFEWSARKMELEVAIFLSEYDNDMDAAVRAVVSIRFSEELEGEEEEESEQQERQRTMADYFTSVHWFVYRDYMSELFEHAFPFYTAEAARYKERHGRTSKESAMASCWLQHHQEAVRDMEANRVKASLAVVEALITDAGISSFTNDAKFQEHYRYFGSQNLRMCVYDWLHRAGHAATPPDPAEVIDHRRALAWEALCGGPNAAVRREFFLSLYPEHRATHQEPYRLSWNKLNKDAIVRHFESNIRGLAKDWVAKNGGQEGAARAVIRSLQDETHGGGFHIKAWFTLHRHHAQACIFEQLEPSETAKAAVRCMTFSHLIKKDKTKLCKLRATAAVSWASLNKAAYVEALEASKSEGTFGRMLDDGAGSKLQRSVTTAAECAPASSTPELKAVPLTRSTSLPALAPCD